MEERMLQRGWTLDGTRISFSPMGRYALFYEKPPLPGDNALHNPLSAIHLPFLEADTRGYHPTGTRH